MSRIAVLDDYADTFRGSAACARLSAHEVTVFHDTLTDADALVARLSGFEVLLLTQQRTALSREVITRLPALRLIAQTGRNLSHLDVDACRERGIELAAAGQGTPHSTVELTWALILASARQLPHEVEALKRGAWQTRVGSGLFGKTLGVYGLGRIGARVASVGLAFGMRVVGLGRAPAIEEKARALGVEVAPSREAFFEGADVLTLHLAMSPETHGIVTERDLDRMRPDALLVNTSRAGLIEEGALVRALSRGRPGRVAVDVFEHEPVIEGAHPLLAMPGALCTPHLGYAVTETLEAYWGTAVDGILAWAARCNSV